MASFKPSLSLQKVAFAGNALCLANGDAGLQALQLNLPNDAAGWRAYE